MVPFERAIVVSYRAAMAIHCNRCAISNRSATTCHGMSPTRKSTGAVGHFGVKFVEGVDRCNVISERHRAVVCIRNRVDISERFGTMHERDKQED